MPVHNSEIAEIFSTTADYLELEGANRFRVRAYRDAARTVKELSRDVADMLDNGEDLSELAGIGEDLAGKIGTIVETGELPLLEDLRDELPPGLREMMRLEGLGARRIRKLHDELGVESLDDLGRAVENNEVRGVEGFGEKTEKNIAREIEKLRDRGDRIERFRLADAERLVGPLAGYIENIDGVKDMTVAGSFRRGKETVGDIDILVTRKRGADVMDEFVDYEDVEDVLSGGDTKSTVVLRSGLQVDLRVVQQVSYGSAMQYFTGSKSHSIELRKIAQDKGYKLNEYGVFDGDDRIAGRTEESVYKALGLPWIAPELRENRGEVEAARNDELPRLLEEGDIRGDLHVHTDATDGRSTIQEMVSAAEERGYDYLGISDHSKQVSVAGGLDADELEEHIGKMEEVGGRHDDIVILKGCEVDILADGSLDLPDRVLEKLDIVVASIHYKLNLPEKEQTERMLEALENPLVHIIGHPTGRMINSRDPCEIDLERVMEKAAEKGVAMELNANPDRLDLNDTHCRMAAGKGVKIVINTDAHSTGNLDYMRYGVGQARRGWLEAGDVLNTLTLSKLKKALERK